MQPEPAPCRPTPPPGTDWLSVVATRALSLSAGQVQAVQVQCAPSQELNQVVYSNSDNIDAEILLLKSHGLSYRYNTA